MITVKMSSLSASPSLKEESAHETEGEERAAQSRENANQNEGSFPAFALLAKKKKSSVKSAERLSLTEQAFARGQTSLPHLSFFQALFLRVFLSSFFPPLPEASPSGKPCAEIRGACTVQALETGEADSLLMWILGHLG